MSRPRPTDRPRTNRAAEDVADGLAVKAERVQWSEAERHKAAAADPELHPRGRARAERLLAQREKRERREGNHADRLIEAWEANADAMLANPTASAAERHQAIQIKTICTAGLRRVPNGSRRLEKVQVAQRIVDAVLLPFLERRTVQRPPRDTPLSIPSALLLATAPAPQSHDPSTRAPDRGPPPEDQSNDDPPLDARQGEARSAPVPPVEFADAGSADGPAFVAYLERRGLLSALRGAKHWTRQIRRWRIAGSRIELATVDDLMVSMFREPACTIRADDRVWQLAKAHAARTVTHGADARRHSTADLMVAA